jgi:rhomboid protease GluP
MSKGRMTPCLTMQTDAAGPVPEISFPVTHEVAGERFSNPDLKGSGRLTIRPDGPTYFFSGMRRTLFSGKPVDLEFKADEIWNVVVTGRAVSFHTQRGNAGAKRRPFGFYCRDAADARSVAALLPAAMDHDFVAVRNFSERLNALSEARSPWTSVTNIIIALNVLVFVAMGLLGAGWFQVTSIMPYILYGANQGAATTDGEWWRLLTSMFMHYGLLHLLLNMWALHQAGHFLEKLQGRWLYALTYIGSGLAGGFASILWNGDRTWSAGASGAVFGVYGAILGYLLREKQGLPKSIYQSLMKSSLTFAGYNILFGAAHAATDNAAHVGGVLAGIALGWLVALPVDRAVREQQTGRRLQWGALAVIAMIVAGVLCTPRFDYSVRDELAWTDANRLFTSRETELLKQNQTALADLPHGGDSLAHAEWLNTQLVPFYRSWNEKIANLSLKPGKQTAKQRDGLEKIIQRRLESYEHLAAALKAHQPDAIQRYSQEDAKIDQEISNFNGR